MNPIRVVWLKGAAGRVHLPERGRYAEQRLRIYANYDTMLFDTYLLADPSTGIAVLPTPR